MKVAVFHSYLDNIGGAERVGLILTRELGADVYTTNIDAQKIAKMGFADILPRIHSIGKIPLNAPFRQQAALWRFGRLNLAKLYDFYIIEGDWAMSGISHNKPNLWYIHSPIREIWDLREFTRKNNVKPALRQAFDIWVTYNRHLNKKYADSANGLVCNSRNTQDRIKKFLNKDAQVIYPPVQTGEFNYKKNGDYWLSVNRLINHKRVDLQTKAFLSLPLEKLVIVGSYEQSRHFKRYAQRCKQTMPANIKIVSWVAQNELADLYANCKGFITTSKDEDFGLTAVEAMASGKPVVAPNEGGYKESVVNGKTGILIDDIDVNKLVAAIKEIGKNPESYKEPCLARAKEFDTAVFIAKIKQQIASVYNDHVSK